MTIPGDAKTISFNFIFHSVSAGEYLSFGVNDTQLFALESNFVTDGTLYSSGLLDVSQWAGQNVNLLYGYNGQSAGSMTVQDLQFQNVPEPIVFAPLLLITLFARRHRRHHI